MTTYAVIPFTDDIETPWKALEDLQTVYRDYAPPVAFVRYGGTAKQLAEKVGFSKHHGEKTGVVVEIADYHGFANTDLWRWLERP